MTEEEKVETPQVETETLFSKEELLEKEVLEMKDKYLRLLAESENTRKRLQKEKSDMMRFSVENLALEFLSPIENLENALGFAGNMSEETANWAKGFQMILTQFKEVLSSNNISPFSSIGAAFDPHSHEAVEIEEISSGVDGIVIQEYSKGYKSGTKTIRPARVKVAKLVAPKEENTQN